jgi:arginine exporter protein ArgO
MYSSSLGADTLPAAFAGVAAGLGVAIPLGAVGVLLFQEGMTRGRRSALAAASGVAAVDLVYSALAVLAGAAVATALTGREGVVRLTGAIILAGLAFHGLFRTVQQRRRPELSLPRVASAGSAFLRFVGLTALNPLTAVYFTVLAAGLGERLREPAAGAAFVVGVFAGSWLWQVLVALAGTAAGALLPMGLRTWTSVAGYSITLGLAVALALSA